jgi:hypothetical protein
MTTNEDAEEIEKLKTLYAKAVKLKKALEKAQTDEREFLQGDAKTRLQTACKNFDELEKEITTRLGKLYLTVES